MKKKLVEDGYEQAKLALQNGNHISSIHKWYGILLNEKSQYGSSEEQIRCAYEVLDHFEETCRLNPRDPTGYYCLGSWSVIEFSDLPIHSCVLAGIMKSLRFPVGNAV